MRLHFVSTQRTKKSPIIVSTRWTKRSPGGWLLCEPKGPRDHQAGDCFLNPRDQEITRRVIVVWTQRTRNHQADQCCVNPKDQEITRHQAGNCCVNTKDQEITMRVSVVWTLRTTRLPEGWLLSEPRGPRDYQAGDCCVNPKDLAGDCCVNAKDQEITRRVIIVWTLGTRRSPDGWLLCEPKGPGHHQTGDCSGNPKDQEITRRVIVAESLFVNMVAERTQPFVSAGRPFQERREGDVSR